MSEYEDMLTKRRNWLYGSIASLAALGGAGLAWWRLGLTDVDEAALAAMWRLSLVQPDGTPLPLSGMRGRPLLLNFWATWCPPCIEELPLLNAFYQKNKANGWQVVGVAVDRAAPVRDFLARQALEFPVVLAGMEGIALSKSMGNTGGGLPFTLVLSTQGAVLDRKVGKVSPQDLLHWGGLK